MFICIYYTLHTFLCAQFIHMNGNAIIDGFAGRWMSAYMTTLKQYLFMGRMSCDYITEMLHRLMGPFIIGWSKFIYQIRKSILINTGWIMKWIINTLFFTPVSILLFSSALLSIDFVVLVIIYFSHFSTNASSYKKMILMVYKR